MSAGSYDVSSRPPVKPDLRPSSAPAHQNAAHSFNHSLQRHDQAARNPMPRAENKNASTKNPTPGDKDAPRVDDEEENLTTDEHPGREIEQAESMLPGGLEVETSFIKLPEIISEHGLFGVAMENGEMSSSEGGVTAMSLEDFSAAIEQAVQNRLLGGNKEWHFSINLPFAQVTLMSSAAARWSVGIASSQADSKQLSKYTDQLKSRLKELGQTIEGIDIVKQATYQS
jgi:hypothetical protein